MRLDRYLANAGHGSRSEVKDFIRRGLVRVDGQIIRDSGYAVREDGSQQVEVSGQTVILQRQVHLMLNKPAGLITAMEDPQHRTVAELIPSRWQSAGLFPVGRLDRDATGLLILTNDGTLCHRLASPRWQVWKTYRVMVDGRPFSEDERPVFKAGLRLSDGQICRPAELTILGDTHALLTIHEGKFHQVKRMMLSTGRQVIALHRLSVGPLQLDEKLAPGECRELTDKEIKALYDLVGMEADSFGS